MYIKSIYQDSFGHKWEKQILISLCNLENLWLDQEWLDPCLNYTKDWSLSTSHFSSLLLFAFWIYCLFSHIAEEAVSICWILGRGWLAYLGHILAYSHCGQKDRLIWLITLSLFLTEVEEKDREPC